MAVGGSVAQVGMHLRPRMLAATPCRVLAPALVPLLLLLLVVVVLLVVVHSQLACMLRVTGMHRQQQSSKQRARHEQALVVRQAHVQARSANTAMRCCRRLAAHDLIQCGRPCTCLDLPPDRCSSSSTFNSSSYSSSSSYTSSNSSSSSYNSSNSKHCCSRQLRQIKMCCSALRTWSSSLLCER